MALRLGDHAPDFHAETTLGPLRFHAWKGTSWAMPFSHPRGFTPVCTTELGTLARLLPAFERRDVKVLGLSVDSVPDHALWAADIAETQQVALSFPLIGDSQRHVARLYDMIRPGASETTTVRSVFVIDPDNRVRPTLAYPASTGRSFVELLRAVDALQLSARHAVATPAEWRNGGSATRASAGADRSVVPPRSDPSRCIAGAGGVDGALAAPSSRRIGGRRGLRRRDPGG